MEVNQFANLALMQSKDGKFAEQILPYNMQFSPLTTVAPLGKKSLADWYEQIQQQCSDR